MAEKKMLIPFLLLGGVGIGFYLYNKDDTPVGLTTTNVIIKRYIGKNTDGKQLTAKVVHGTWRADKDSIPITTTSDKPLLVFYEESEPFFADVIEWDVVAINADPAKITECQTTKPSEDDAVALEEWNTACDEATILFERQEREQWREIAKAAGATEESIDEQFPEPEEEEEEETEESAAESWLGIKNPQMFINTLQSNQVW